MRWETFVVFSCYVCDNVTGATENQHSEPQAEGRGKRKNKEGSLLADEEIRTQVRGLRRKYWRRRMGVEWAELCGYVFKRVKGQVTPTGPRANSLIALYPLLLQSCRCRRFSTHQHPRETWLLFLPPKVCILAFAGSSSSRHTDWMDTGPTSSLKQVGDPTLA